MKVGDKVEVRIGSHVVAQAEVKELGDGTATLIIPGTKVVMGTRTDLTDLPQNEVTGGGDHQILGVDREGESVDLPAPAPVEEQTPSTNSEQVQENAPVENKSESVDPAELSNVESSENENQG